MNSDKRPARYGVGVDLGTTFTSAAVCGPEGPRVVSLSQEVVVPSVAYAAPDGTLLTGVEALAAATEPAQVARGYKRRLGDPTPLVLGGSAYSPSALMAAQLRDVLAVVTRSCGCPPSSIVLTCPAIWGPYRREHFTEVLRLAHVSDFQLISEPEAAATHYSKERRLGDGEVVAVYDLGGGTFDTTILRMRNGQMEILGTPEGIEHMGGMDFDEALLTHIDARLDGVISELDPTDPDASTTLATIRGMCVRAKEELSIEPDVRLSVPLPSGPREVTVTRLEFNDMIKPPIGQTIEALHHTIHSAGLRAQDLSAILLAGGSSRIPLVSQQVTEEFGRPVRVTLHPKFTVALGAAAIAARLRPANAIASPQVSAKPTLPTLPVPALPTPPKPPSTPTRAKRLVPALAVKLVAILGAAAALLAWLLPQQPGRLNEAIPPSSYKVAASSWPPSGPRYEEDPLVLQENNVTHTHAHGESTGRFVYQIDIGEFTGDHIELTARLSANASGYFDPENRKSDVTLKINGAHVSVQQVRPDDSRGDYYTWRFDSTLLKEGLNTIEFSVEEDAENPNGLCIYGDAVAPDDADERITLRSE